MKTIKGTVVSSKPIRLSKAAAVLKNFISKETGASGALSSFLRKTSDSFNELAQFHKEMRSTKKSGSKQKKSRVEGKNKEDGEVGEEGKKLDFGGERSLKSVDNGVSGSDVEGSGKKKKKKKKKQKKKDGDVEVEKKTDRKRKKAEEEEKSRSLEDSQERHGRKKKKTRHEEH